MQKTLKCEATISGIGLFTGEKVSLRLQPALPDSGIVFQRLDLPGNPTIPAQLAFVSDTRRCTRLSTNESNLTMVEHLLSALSGLEIDNLNIAVTGPEMPSGDGSAQVFVDVLEKAGYVEQEVPRHYFKPSYPVFWSEKDTHLIALPSDEFRISYTLHYPQSSLLGSQYLSLLINRETYIRDIALCRTFSLYEEIAPFLEKGFIKGGGLENGVVIQNDRVLNPGGVRFPDEMVRHKILDLIGDLSLIGQPIRAHIIAMRSGHTSNVAFAKMLQNEFKTGIVHKKECKALKGAS